MGLLSSFLDHLSAKKTAKRQQKIADRLTEQDAIEFDRRMGEVGKSDTRIAGLLDDQYTDTSGLEDEIFSYMLENNRKGFDTQQTVAGKAMEDQNTAFGGLMTSQRKARLSQQAASEEERQRQLGFQDQADGLAAALPGEVGYDAQQVAFGDALGRRLSFAADNMTGPTPASFGGGPLVEAEYARQAGRGYGEGLIDTAGSAKLSSYGDAFASSERKLGDFAGDIDALTTKATISRSALPYEIAVGDLDRRNAADAYDDRYSFIVDDAARRSGAASDYFTNLGGAKEVYGNKYGAALDAFFNRSLESEGNYTSALLGTSQNYMGKMTNLGNYKMQNTSTFNPLSQIVKEAERALAAGMGGA